MADKVIILAAAAPVVSLRSAEISVNYRAPGAVVSGPQYSGNPMGAPPPILVSSPQPEIIVSPQHVASPVDVEGSGVTITYGRQLSTAGDFAGVIRYEIPRESYINFDLSWVRSVAYSRSLDDTQQHTESFSRVISYGRGYTEATNPFMDTLRKTVYRTLRDDALFDESFDWGWHRYLNRQESINNYEDVLLEFSLYCDTSYFAEDYIEYFATKYHQPQHTQLVLQDDLLYAEAALWWIGKALHDDSLTAETLSLGDQIAMAEATLDSVAVLSLGVMRPTSEATLVATETFAQSINRATSEMTGVFLEQSLRSVGRPSVESTGVSAESAAMVSQFARAFVEETGVASEDSDIAFSRAFAESTNDTLEAFLRSMQRSVQESTGVTLEGLSRGVGKSVSEATGIALEAYTSSAAFTRPFVESTAVTLESISRAVNRNTIESTGVSSEAGLLSKLDYCDASFFAEIYVESQRITF
jgi:hypothetical protein